MKKNVIVGQSGGPTAVINASLYGVVKEAENHFQEIGTVYGMINGIEGFLKGYYIDIMETLTAEELELLRLTPSSFLGSCRYRLPESMDSPVYAAVFERFRQLNIGIFIYVGGNDSMDTVYKLSEYAALHQIQVKIVGIPKTIDNDLMETDHTPGYGSAAKYVASTVRDVVLDASVYDSDSVTIVEIMGRNAGWLTAASVLARKAEGDNPILIYLPEAAFEPGQFLKDIERVLITHRQVIICVSEGIRDLSGCLICEYENESGTDEFGHKQLHSCGRVLENLIKEHFSCKVRSIELNVSQRCSGSLVSKTDVEEASRAGAYGVQEALAGRMGGMVSFERISQNPYRMVCHIVPVAEVCNREKCFPKKWILNHGTDISPEFAEYLLPLIQGEVVRRIEDGLPVYCWIKGKNGGKQENENRIDWLRNDQ